ncbi:triphosphoribosyl-dephospho-CoA synthase [Prosthecomicrobium sp. N25]|uniref:triphosphoribosyl-dephospho-CoA synthase n=1 Tax=Prosthecomicrobium sp. N25 TaxID=3129254 RepID=UPI0030779B38
MSGLGAAAIAAAFRAACLDELQALKPGNVHVHAAGHRMTVRDFEASAEAAAPHVAARGASVGARILGAMRATWAAVGQNTNLGILLLAGPLAAAAERGGEPWVAIAEVLAGLDARDAEDVFAAIRLADPGGLGAVPEHDVRGPAGDLLAAMAAAADRDSIARQYATGFRDIRIVGLPALDAAVARSGFGPQAVTETYLAFLAAFPDSHVLRKHGAETAEEIRREASRLRETVATSEARVILLQTDSAWKSRGINPGTSADLTVATILHRRMWQNT